MLLFFLHYFYIYHCLDISLYHVYYSNDFVFVFMIAVATMDHNADILRVIGHLRDIGSALRVETKFTATYHHHY